MKLVIPAAVALALAACSKDPASSEAPPPTTSTKTTTTTVAPPAGGGAATAKATEIFTQRCTPCHGPGGAGDGPASSGLNPKPRNFTDVTWQASVDDAYIEKIIKYGGAAVGKSAAMPSNPDITDEAVIRALRAHVRSLAAK